MSPHQPKPSGFSDIHLVETPEQIRLELPLSGIGSRCLAMGVDVAIQVGVGLVLLVVMIIVAKSKASKVWIVAIIIGGFFLLHFGYFVLFEIFWKGQTPGKRVMKLRVIKDSGRALSAPEVVGRNLLRIVDQLPGFYAVGLITMAFSNSNKRLGDLVAGSVVIREAAAAEMALSWNAKPAEVGALPLGANRLSAEDLALVDSFLARREQLDGNTRQKMADQIVAHVAKKMELSDEQRYRPETTLEALAWESRGRG